MPERPREGGYEVSIKALIVDDEPLARQRIRQLLADESDIEVVAEQAEQDLILYPKDILIPLALG